MTVPLFIKGRADCIAEVMATVERMCRERAVSVWRLVMAKAPDGGVEYSAELRPEVVS